MKLEKRNLILLYVLGFLSLGLISLTDKYFFALFKSIDPSLAIVADLRLTSLLIVVLIWLLFGRKNSNNQTVEVFHYRKLLVPAIWLLFTAYFVLVKQVWVPKLNTWIDYVAFMATGLAAEELLFRGSIFNLCAVTFGFRKIGKISVPVWISSILFSLQHLGYHGFTISSESISQVIYTFIMGLVFGSLKESSGYLWPVIVLHVFTNSFTVIRNFN